MRAARVAAFVWATAGLCTTLLACYPCGGPCDDTVYPFPIQSSGYQLQSGEFGNGGRCLAEEEDGGTPHDGGHLSDGGDGTDGGSSPDAGVVTDGDEPCDQTVSVDAAARTVTHTFTQRGRKHVIRYRASSVETISKDRLYLEEW